MKNRGNGIPMGAVPVQFRQPGGAPAPGGDLPSADEGNPSTAPKRVKGLDLLDGARAVGKWLLLERVMDAEKSAGGIIVPDAVREKPAWIVRSVGDDVKIAVKVGDHVSFDGTRILEGTDQKGNRRAVCFAMEGQIMGVLNPKALTNVILTTRAAP